MAEADPRLHDFSLCIAPSRNGREKNTIALVVHSVDPRPYVKTKRGQTAVGVGSPIRYASHLTYALLINPALFGRLIPPYGYPSRARGKMPLLQHGERDFYRINVKTLL